MPVQWTRNGMQLTRKSCARSAPAKSDCARSAPAKSDCARSAPPYLGTYHFALGKAISQFC